MKKVKNEKEVGFIVPPINVITSPFILSAAKRVKTYDTSGKENGFLVELGKSGNLTTSYLTAIYPKCFKGLHLHRIRVANYVCIRGKVKIILYPSTGRQEYILSEENSLRLTIPTNIPTGLLNETDEEAWIINNPDPFYDPLQKGEQIDYTQEQLSALFDEPKEKGTFGREPIQTLPYVGK